MSLNRIDHTAIAVRDMDEALARYQRIFGLEVTHREIVPEQNVEVAFLAAGPTQLELIRPIAAGTGVSRFLERHGESLHHVAFAVDDIQTELERLDRQGVELIDRVPRSGVDGQIAFLHPRGTGGVLFELVEPPRPID